MSTQLLDNTTLPELQPARALWARYDPATAPYRFQAQTLEEAHAWQTAVRPVLTEALGFTDLALPPFAAPLEPQRIERVDKGDYVREKWLLRTSTHTQMPIYLLIPQDKPGPHPVALALHGHGYGVKDIVGLWEDGAERDTPEGYHCDFGIALCRRGFLVAAPEISCFGERQTDFSYLNRTIGQGAPTTCTHTAMLALHLGGSVAGLRAHDARRLVDYLETRPDADVSRLGAMGISGGGMHTFLSTCTDTRIKTCVVSGYYSTFKDSILAMQHCACNFVPGLGQFGEMYDLVGLIAPRPMLVEAGTYDPIFPLRAVQSSVARAREVYAVFGPGAEARVATDIFEGRHRISGAQAYDFLWQHVGAEGAR